MKQRVVLLGTGTGVGKTHVGEALARALVTRGERVVALKPVETGVGTGAVGDSSDARRLSTASMFHVKRSLYELRQPVSPHRAAREEGRSIDLGAITAWVDRHDAGWVLVETAGGLLSPLSQEHTNLDLARRLEPSAAVLVAVDRLGVLHDVAACRVALQSLAPDMLAILHVVLCAPEAADSSTGANAIELRTLGIAGSVFEFPRGGAMGADSQRMAGSLIDAIEVGGAA